MIFALYKGKCFHHLKLSGIKELFIFMIHFPYKNVNNKPDFPIFGKAYTPGETAGTDEPGAVKEDDSSPFASCFRYSSREENITSAILV